MRAPEGVTSGARIPLSSLELLSSAVSEIEAAVVEPKPEARYVRGHLVALRAAAAVLATRARPGGREGPRNMWIVLPKVAPELQEWARYFAAGTGKQAAAVAGMERVVTAREADDLVREAHNFLDLVVATLASGSSSAAG